MKRRNNYPDNVLKVVFGDAAKAAEPEKLKVFLVGFIPRRLTAEESELFFARFGDGITLKNIAIALDVTYAEVRRLNENVMRKIRHPSSSAYLKAYLAEK